MRKITSLMSLLLLFIAGTAQGQDMTPTIGSTDVLNVGSKVASFTAATSADDNDHWYIITQARECETPIYNAGTGQVVTRAASLLAPSLNNTVATESSKYLVRFISTGSDGLYNMQFADGNYIKSDLTTSTSSSDAAAFAFYNSNSGTGSYYGWNLGSNTGQRLDNTGPGNVINFWESGTVSGTSSYNSGYNVWTLYETSLASDNAALYKMAQVNSAVSENTYSLQTLYGVSSSSKITSPSSESTWEGNLPNMIDNDATTYHHSDWHGTAATPHNMTYELTDATEAVRFYINQRGNGVGQPYNVTVAGSNDNSTFTDVATENLAWSANYPDLYSQAFTATESYKYWRISVNSSYHSRDLEDLTANSWYCASEFYVLPNNSVVNTLFNAENSFRAGSVTDESSAQTLLDNVNAAIASAQQTTQDDVSPNKCYTVTTNGRGSWTMATDGSALRSTSNINQTVDETNTDQQWAFVEYGGNTYLYNVGQQKFILKNGTEASASANIGTPIELYRYTSTEMAGWGEDYDAFQSDGFYFCVKMGTDGTYPTYINFNTATDGYQTRVTAWGPGNTDFNANCGADAGNALKIVEVGEFDPTAALESLKWSINFDKSTVSTHDSRYTNMVGLDDSQISWTSQAGDVIYRDLTDQTITVSAGSTVTPYIGFRGHAMYGYLYIDYNNDGDFTDDGEFVSQTTTDWADSDASDKTLPDFTVTSTTGTYRARFKVAWNNTDPGGEETDMVSNGGSITDVTLNVESGITPPLFSTNETSHWYQIKFKAGSCTTIADQGSGNAAAQARAAKSGDQLWRFIGDETSFKIQNKANSTYLYVDGSTVKSTSDASQAGTFSLALTTNSTYIPAYMISNGSGYFNAWSGIVVGNSIGIWNSTSDTNNVIEFVAEDDIEVVEYVVSGIASYAPEHQSTLWYNVPPHLASGLSGDLWKDYALPLGNGQLGSTFLGNVYKEDLQFNEKTLWTGRSTDQATYGSYVGGSGYGGYQNFGDVIVKQMDTDAFDFEDGKGVTNYLRQLDLTTATGTVSFTSEATGVNYKRQYIVSNPDNVAAYVFTADQAGKQTLQITLASGKPGVDATTNYSNGEAWFSGSLETVSYNARIKVVNRGGTIQTDDSGIMVTGADSVFIYVAAGTDYDPSSSTYTSETLRNALSTTMQDRVTAAAARAWGALYADHVADHQSLYNRVEFVLDAASNTQPTETLVNNYTTTKGTTDAGALMLEKLYFDYGRYLTIAGSRGIALPTNLQGIWNNSSSAPWGADIHANINVQMNYWPAEPTNLSECHLPFLNYIINMSGSPQWTDNATSMAGQTVGWTCITENNIFGGRGSFQTNYVIANAWYATHLWQHYRYTLDRTFLVRAFPAMWGATQFWMERLVLASDGTYECPNEYSPEHGPSCENGVAHAQQLVAALFDATLQSAAILGDDAGISSTDLATLQDRYDKLDKGLAIEEYTGDWGDTVNGISTGTSILREWKYSDYTAGSNGHRHSSHLMCLYPFNQVTEGTDLFNAAVNSLQLRGDASTGWSMAWKVNLWARAKDGAHAHQIFNYALVPGTGSGGVFYNLFDVHAPYYFQIDGNFGACSGMAEMLMQSHTGTIEILPALPEALWVNGHINGLKAVGDFTVDIAWQNAKASEVVITNNQGQTLNVKCTGIGTGIATITIGGAEVTPTIIDDDNVTIPSSQGDEVHITFSYPVASDVAIVDGTNDPIGTLNTRSSSSPYTLSSLEASGMAGITVSNLAVADQGTWGGTRYLTIRPSAVKTAEKITITAPLGYVITSYTMNCCNFSSSSPYLVDTSDEYSASTATSLATYASSTTISVSDISKPSTSFWVYCNGNSLNHLMISSLVVHVEPAPVYDVTYAVKDVDNNVIYTSDPVDATVGTVITTLPEAYQLTDFYEYNTLSATVTGDMTVAFTATQKENPLVKFTTNTTSPIWYFMTIRPDKSSSTAYPTYVSSGTPNVTLPTTNAHDNTTQWAFIGNPYAGFQIINNAAGTDLVLGSAAATGDGGSTYATLAAAGSQTYENWFVTPSSYVDGGIFINNAAGQYFNLRSNDHLAYWTGGHDLGSTFKAAITPYFDDFCALFEPYTTAAASHAGEIFQLASSGDALTAFETKKTTATNNAANSIDLTQDEYNEAVAAFKAAIVMPATGYYRIKSNMVGTDNYGYIGLRADSVFIGNISSPLTDASTVFYVQKSGDLYSFSTEGVYTKVASQSADVGFDDNVHNFIVGTNAPGNGYILTSGSNAYSAYHVSKNQDYRLVGWTTGALASQFIFEPATTITLNLHDGKDGYKYATTYLPFDITLPDGVTAYAMVYYDTESVARITEIGQSVPAGTAVLLKSSSVESAEAAITTGLTSLAISNALSGTYFSTTLTDGQYSLGIANNKVGFYRLTDALSANRAYLTTASGIRAIYFEEDEVTGIGNAGAGGVTEGETYDLQGRRVTTMQRNGIYIINGKKVVK